MPKSVAELKALLQREEKRWQEEWSKLVRIVGRMRKGVARQKRLYKAIAQAKRDARRKGPGRNGGPINLDSEGDVPDE